MKKMLAQKLTKYPKKLRHFALGWTIFLLTGVCFLYGSSLGQRLELSAYDMLLNLGFGPKISDDVVIVAIDDNTLHNLETSWPIDRGVYAKVFQNLSEAGAAVIGVDILLTEERDAKGDQELRTTLASLKTNLVFASEFYGNTHEIGAAYIFSQGMNLPVFGEKSGFVNVFPDPDARVREFLPYKIIENQAYFSLDMVMLATFLKQPLMIKAGQLYLGKMRVPVNENKQVYIRYTKGLKELKKYNFYEISENLFKKSDFKNKIAILSPFFNASKDKYFAPALEGKIFGGEIHAQIINMFLTQRFIWKMPGWVAVLLNFGITLLLLFLFFWAKALSLRILALSLGFYGGMILLCFELVSWVLPFSPLLILGFSFSGFYGLRLHNDFATNRQIVDLFNSTNLILKNEAEKEKTAVLAKDFAQQYRITNAEAEIILLLYQGFTIKEIASQRFNSYTTVKKHVHNIYMKLGVAGKEEFNCFLQEKKCVIGGKK